MTSYLVTLCRSAGLVQTGLAQIRQIRQIREASGQPGSGNGWFARPLERVSGRVFFTIIDGKDRCRDTVYVGVPLTRSRPAVDTTSVVVESFGT